MELSLRLWARAAHPIGIAGALVGLAMVAVALPPWLALADDSGFYVRNQGDVALSAVYVSPIFSKRWRDDRLGAGPVPPGEDAWVPVERGEATECFFDIRVEDSAGQPYEYWGVDLCGTHVLNVP